METGTETGVNNPSPEVIFYLSSSSPLSPMKPPTIMNSFEQKKHSLRFLKTGVRFDFVLTVAEIETVCFLNLAAATAAEEKYDHR